MVICWKKIMEGKNLFFTQNHRITVPYINSRVYLKNKFLFNSFSEKYKELLKNSQSKI